MNFIGQLLISNLPECMFMYIFNQSVNVLKECVPD